MLKQQATVDFLEFLVKLKCICLEHKYGDWNDTYCFFSTYHSILTTAHVDTSRSQATTTFLVETQTVHLKQELGTVIRSVVFHGGRWDD